MDFTTIILSYSVRTIIAISDTREIMFFRQNFNAAHMEACRTSFSVSSSSAAAGAEPIIPRQPDLLEDATFKCAIYLCRLNNTKY